MIAMKTSHQLAQAAHWLLIEAEQHAHQEALVRHHNLLSQESASVTRPSCRCRRWIPCWPGASSSLGTGWT